MLRSQYLFELARTCNIGPRMVDALRCRDFFNLITGIDEAKKREDAEREAQNG